MIYVKTAEEIEKMRLASDLVSRTLGEVAKWVKPGETTHRLDSIAREFILDNGGKPACLGVPGIPRHPVYRGERDGGSRISVDLYVARRRHRGHGLRG